MTVVVFTVHGKAQPAGSKRAFAHKHTGRIVVTDANAKSRPWKQQVAEQAAIAMRDQSPLEGPLALHVVFYLPRPKAHLNAKGIRPSAPRWPTVKPDTTKLLRAVEDACTGVIWRDDAQIISQVALKRYADNTGVCVDVRVYPVDDERVPVPEPTIVDGVLRSTYVARALLDEVRGCHEADGAAA